MNYNIYLQSKGREIEANQVDFMTSQLLVTTKRATQAVEMYRKMQIKALNSATSNMRQRHKQFI
jgi:nucleoside diphosphate kinase